MAKVYSVFNGAGPTTAAPVAVTTGTAVKTMIQLSTSASSEARVVEWWWEGDGSAAATPGTIELMFHSSGAATVTAYAAADIKKYDPNGRASLLTLGTANSGFTASAEGTPATALGSMAHKVPPTSGIYIQYPLGREPEMAVSTFCRLRNTLGAAVNALCGVAWEE
jgi:hypothetical protein